jgi:hypothetical protein
MKIAFILGFFDPVRKALKECYPEDTYSDRILWISSGNGTVTAFKGRYYDVVSTADSILVCVGASSKQKALLLGVDGIVSSGAAAYPQTPVKVEKFGNLFDGAPVLACVKQFGVEAQPPISVAQIRRRIPAGKILCVSPAGKTTIKVALERIGFSVDALNECFEEKLCQTARNSNLMQELESRAKTYPCLLYAWEGLRTSDPEIQKKYTHGWLEARSAAQVAALFHKWIVEGV